MELSSDDGFAANLAALPPADNAPPPPGLLERGFDDVTSQDFAGRAGRSFRAGLSKVVENDLSFGISDDVVMARQYAPILEAINQQQQRGFADFVDNPFLSSSLNPLNAAKRLATGQPLSRDGLIDYVWQQVDQGRKDNPGLFGQLPKNHDDVIADAQAEQRAAIGYANDLAESGGPLSGTAASFAGQAVGGMADPVNIAATALGFPASESLLKTALIEGGANLAVDAAGLPGRITHYQAIGEPMSAGDVAGELAGSALLGAGLGVGGKLIARIVGLKGHALADEFAAQNPDAPPIQRSAMAMVQAEADLKASNPLGADNEDLHRQAVVAAMGALDDRNPAALEAIHDQVASEAGPEFRASQDAAAQEALNGIVTKKTTFGDVAASHGLPPPQAVIEASKATHIRSVDPEALPRFSDPVKKPDAFHEQSEGLARELAPPPEKPIPVAQAKAAAAPAEKPPEFGPAQAQVEALQRMDQTGRFPDPISGTEVTVKSQRQQIERQARAVERLRGCVEEPE